MAERLGRKQLSNLVSLPLHQPTQITSPFCNGLERKGVRGLILFLPTKYWEWVLRNTSSCVFRGGWMMANEQYVLPQIKADSAK